MINKGKKSEVAIHFNEILNMLSEFSFIHVFSSAIISVNNVQ